MRPVSSQDIVRFLQDKRNMGRETVIITGMTIFNVENLLFCNNNIIGHQVLVNDPVKFPVDFAYKIHVCVHTILV